MPTLAVGMAPDYQTKTPSTYCACYCLAGGVIVNQG